MNYSLFSKFMMSIGMMTIAVTAFAREGGKGHGERMKEGRRGVEARIQNQERRIQKGVEKGKLTQDEAAKLQEGVNAIKEEAKSAVESDGKVTKEERKALRKKLKASSEAIRNAKKPEGEPAAEGSAAPAAPAEGGAAE
jgi:peptidoglycan hydrolase CwlO-like protein